MSKKRITKKKLKEDAFVSATFEAGHFVQENLTSIILGIAGFIVAIGIIWMYTNYSSERSNEAGLAMFKAQNLYINGQYALAASDFERVSEEYSGTDAGEKAVFYAGDSHFKAGDLNQALTFFERCRDELSEDDPLMLNAIVGQAAVYEELKDFEKSIQYYQEALELAVYDYQKIEILDALSRVMALAGRNREALEMMDRIIENYPDNPRTGTVTERKAEMLARYFSSTGTGN